MATNPFQNFSFDTGAMADPAETSVSNDDITQVLLKANAKTPYLNAPVQGGTAEGVKRVNENSTQNGVVAFRDNKGQAVLTNVAKDTDGVEKPLAALLRSPEAPTQGKVAPSVTGTPLDILSALTKLKATSDPAEAQAIYQSVTQSITQQDADITKSAFQFAENKLAIPQLTKNLEMARQADSQDINWYPGIGDSERTQKIVQQLFQARGFADNEAKNYLVQHAGYKSLASLKATADGEMKRIQTLQDRKDLFEFNRDVAKDSAKVASTEAYESKMLAGYEGLSRTQLANIDILNAGDLAGFKDITDDTKRKIKTMQLVMNKGKDKGYQEAVSAETNQQLFGLAITGNKYARTLMIAKEANTLGISANDVEAQLTTIQRKTSDPKFITEVLSSRIKDPKELKAKEAEFKAMELAGKFDPTKKQVMDSQRVSLIQEYAENAKTTMFKDDVRSWGSVDPLMLAAIDKSVKTTGKADAINVFAAYVGDATDTERIFKMTDFKRALRVAAEKHQDSAFGMPRYREVEAELVRSTVEAGWFSKAIKVLGRGLGNPDNGIGVPLVPVAPAARALVQTGGDFAQKQFSGE